MKFLCPKCNAKYKVADERVTNRGHPRMKCRQCGHLIDILAAAAAGDAAGPSVPPPAPDDASGVEAVGRSSARPVPGARAPAPANTLVGQPAAAVPAGQAARVAAASRSLPRPAATAAIPRAQRSAPSAQAVARAEPLDAEPQQSPAFDSIDEPAPALENADASETPLEAQKGIAV